MKKRLNLLKKRKYVLLEGVILILIIWIFIIVSKKFLIGFDPIMNIHDTIFALVQENQTDLNRCSDLTILLLEDDSVTLEKMPVYLEKILELNPKVIALNIFYSEENRRENDTTLFNLIRPQGNIVLPFILEKEKRKQSYFIRDTDSISQGFQNTGENRGVVRTFIPQIGTDTHFALKTIELYKGRRIDNIKNTYIDYSFNFQWEPTPEQVLSEEYITDKIVLIGLRTKEIAFLANTPYGICYPTELMGFIICTLLHDLQNPVSLWVHSFSLLLCIILFYILLVAFYISSEKMKWNRIVDLFFIILFFSTYSWAFLLEDIHLNIYHTRFWAIPPVSLIIISIYSLVVFFLRKIVLKKHRYSFLAHYISDSFWKGKID